MQKPSLLLVLATLVCVAAFASCVQGEARSILSLAERAMQMQGETKLKRDHNEGANIHVCFEPVATTGLTYPTSIENAGDGTNRLFITNKGGQISIVEGNQVLGSPFLDISDRVNSSGVEQGLLGLAFHPEYADNGFFYVHYTHITDGNVVERYTRSSPNQANPDSALRIINTKPATEFNNGGQLLFGPDSYLYIAVGDGQNGANAQNLYDYDNFMGKLLRIDVDSDGFPDDDDTYYSIPVTNPFGTPVWAYGLRNPWRNSFDRETGDLYIVDVGEEAYEEINFQAAQSGGSENYGWPFFEGRDCVAEDEDDCDIPALAPVAGYSRGDAGCAAIIGGYVYRGEAEASAQPDMVGKYFYSDFCSGELWVAYKEDDEEDGQEWRNGHESVLVDGTCAGGAPPVFNVVSFGEDENGELYLLGFNGELVRIRASRNDDDAASSLFSFLSYLF